MAERNADYRLMEHHLYACIYEVINSAAAHDQKLHRLNRYKAKLVRLNAQHTERIMLDQHAHDKIQGEQHSLFHLLKQNRRRESRTISSIQDMHGHVFTRTPDICNTIET
jgi:hypothetical protein